MIMKIIAVVLLLAGLGLGALATYGYFFSDDYARCERYRSQAVSQLQQAQAAEGTARGAALLEEARGSSAVADVACRNASQTRQSAMLGIAGGLALIVVSLVLLFVGRKRRA